MATDSSKAREQYELYQFCRVEGGHDNYLREVEVAKRYYASRHWLNEDEKKRTAEGRLSFVVNETFRTINAVRGELNQLSSDVRFDPTNGDDNTARVLNRLNEHVDRQNKLYMHDDRVILDGLLGGRGYYRFKIDFDENMQGHITLLRERPENVVLDFDVDSPDPETWKRVFTTEIVSTDDLEQMYGKDVGESLNYSSCAEWLCPEDRSLAQSIGFKTALRGDDTYGVKRHRLINQQYRDYKYKDCFVDKMTGDIAEIPENWPREKIAFALERFNLGTMKRKIKTLRYRVVCNNLVLFDEDSPYKYFDLVPFFPWFLDDMPLSLFSVLKGPQDLLNYTVSEETFILGNTAHSGWKIKQGSLKNMTARQLEQKGSRNGVVLELDEVSDAERITPGQPATAFAQFGDRARSWINDLGSVTPSMLGSQSEYANGKNITANLTRAPVNLHGPLQAFQFARQMLAERKLDLFQSFYTETRVLKIAPPTYGAVEEITINQPDPNGTGWINDVTVGKYTTRLLPVGSRQAADELAFDQLAYMKELGVTVPNSLFVATSAINAKSDVMEVLFEANSGEVSPEEQRMRELEVAQAELDVEDSAAGIEAKRAAAELARGRAQRAYMDASFDPRVHRARLDEQRLASEHTRGMRQLDQHQIDSNRKTAVDLTKIATDAATKAQQTKAGPAAKKKAATKKKTATK